MEKEEFKKEQKVESKESKKQKSSELKEEKTDQKEVKKPILESEEKKEEKKNPKQEDSKKQKRRRLRIFLIVLLALTSLLTTASFGLYHYIVYIKNKPSDSSENTEVDKNAKEKFYSPLTGLEIPDKTLATSPTFCVQTPNGMDGARPQVGLNEAGVIFEAIAEAGITRFAAIYQNPTSVIGPIRSLRLYYLEWDEPFDCTIVHAGGSPTAMTALRAGKYRDLTENQTYMWRGSSSNAVVYRRWNNLFTSAELLKNFNDSKGYSSSNPTGFARLTPEDSIYQREEAAWTMTANSETVDELPTLKNANKIFLRFGNIDNFNPVYTFNPEKNSYDRAYASGIAHTVYSCPEGIGKVSPELSCGEEVQLSPKVVIAMIVQEGKESDNYHEKITTIGSGKAYIFQNGVVFEGTWEKTAKNTQIIFKNTNGEEIKLAPGQTFISAVPTYGSVSYE